MRDLGKGGNGPASGSRAARSPRRIAIGSGRDLVDRQVRAVELIFCIQADADQELEYAIDDEATDQGDRDTEPSADQLRHEAHTAETPQGLGTENARRDSAPRAAQPMQR